MTLAFTTPGTGVPEELRRRSTSLLAGTEINGVVPAKLPNVTDLTDGVMVLAPSALEGALATAPEPKPGRK